ncbi:MAG: histidinol-phosphate aminotransferase family protein [Gemmatimonadetes bacterium]|nr:histidinol-phosphate aminotransferase family protein [Gemmatimonadota bacterium]
MIRPRPEVLSTPPAVHGGPAGAADEAAPVRLDFSVSLNAWGTARPVREAILSAHLDTYPDPEALAARRAAGARWNRPVEEVAFGAGSAELIHALCFAFVRPGDTALIPSPTFGEYARAVSLCGGRVLQGIARPPTFALETDAIAAAVVQHRPRLVFLCAPNTPTGQPFARDELRQVADACAAAGTLLVLDQSYDAFMREPLGTPALPGHPAVLHLRSITKEHALAGVRAGFALGPAALIGAVERVRPPWPTSSAAQAAAVATLSDAGLAHLGETLPRLRAERERLESAFARLRLPTVRSATHYLLAAVGDAAPLARRLRGEHGIRVRDCTSFGLPGHVRVAARTPGENSQLIAALEAVCCA